VEDLEYDEDESLKIQESDDSGSEFQASEDEEEDEEIMVDAAVLLSLQTMSANGAGTSDCVAGSSPAAILRAAAAERRLARRNQMVEIGDSIAFKTSGALDVYDDDPASSVSSDEEPLSKGKLKPSAKPTKQISAMKKRTMTDAEKRKVERTAYLSSRRANKAKERDLIRKLGRRLTHVSTGFPILSKCV
jgi:DNA repair protein RAD16